MIEHDYTKVTKEEFDMEIQSGVSGFNPTLSIEGSTCEYHNKYRNGGRNEANVNMKFSLTFSDESAHNPATTYEHINFIIYWMYADNFLKKFGIIYDTTDGCIKNIYICR